MVEAASDTDNWRRFIPASLLAAACVGAAWTPAGEDGGPVLCPYRIATGGSYCPGCGATRALGATVRGDLRAAFDLNPWMILILGQFAAIAAFWMAAPGRARAWWGRKAPLVLGANLVVGLVFWVVRMGFGAIPHPF